MEYKAIDKNGVEWKIVTEHRATLIHKRFYQDPYFSYTTSEYVVGQHSCGPFTSEQGALDRIGFWVAEYLKEGYKKSGDLLLIKPGDDGETLRDEIGFVIKEIVASKTSSNSV